MELFVPFGYEALSQLLDIASKARWADWAQFHSKIEAYRGRRCRGNLQHVEWMAIAWSEHFRGNVALSKLAIDRCVADAPSDWLVLANAATLLVNSGAAREAAAVARLVARKFPVAPALHIASKVFVQAMHLEEAMDCCALLPGPRNEHAEIAQMLEVFEYRGLTLERRLKIYETVVDTLRERGAHIVGCHPFLAPEFGFADYTLVVKSDDTGTLDLFHAVVRTLVGRFDDIYDDVFMVSPGERSIPSAELACGEALCL